MRFDALYEFCSSLPHTALSVQWGDHDVFKVGGKMFAILTQDLDLGFRLSIKADPEEFDELCGEHGVRPAPYLARNQWVQIVADNSLGHDRLRSLVARSHALVLEKLSPAQRRSLDAGPNAAPAGEAPRRKKAARDAAKRATASKAPAAKRRPAKAATAKKGTSAAAKKGASAAAKKGASAAAKKGTAAGAKKGATARKAGAAKGKAAGAAKGKAAGAAKGKAGAAKGKAARATKS